VGNYDESSIITAYEGDSEDSSIFSKESGFIKSNSTLDDTRDITGSSRLLSYTVQKGDSIGTIGEKFNVSANSIIWANDFDKNVVLHVNAVIKIPPVTGLAYTVLPGDTIEGLAQKYKVDAKKIAEQNKLALKQELLI
jgi:LysM repeat protein